jgi:hypothetical protein
MSAPANDNFADRITLTGTSFSATVDNTEATLEAGEAAIYTENALKHSVWYEWVAPSDGVLNLDTLLSAGNDDTMVYVFTGASLAALTFIGFNDDTWIDYYSVLNIPVIEGVSYKIAVGGYNSPVGSITLRGSITTKLANDDLADTEVISSLPADIDGSTLCASYEQWERDEYLENGCGSVWYEYTPAGDGVLALEVTDTDFEGEIYIFEGASPTWDNELNSLWFAPDDHSFVRMFSVVGGTTYKFQVNAYAMGGTFSLSVTALPTTPPTNDDFDAAIEFTGDTFNVSTNNYNATVQAGEDVANYNSIWYKYTATENGKLFLYLSSYSTHNIVVFTGSDLATLVKVHTGTNFSIDVVAGETYYIALCSKVLNTTGEVVLYGIMEVPPENDNFEDRISLVDGEAVAGTTNYSTVETGEPSGHGTRSCWYEWINPDNGVLRITVSNSGASVFVYTGDSVDALTLVCSRTTSARTTLDVAVQGGVAYKIAIANWQGDFTLTPEFTSFPNPALFPFSAPVNVYFPSVVSGKYGPAKSYVRDTVSGRIWYVPMLANYTLTVMYSDDFGETWVAEGKTLAQYVQTPYFVLLDSENNLIIVGSKNIGGFQFCILRRIKATGLWDSDVNVTEGISAGLSDACIDDEDKVHVVMENPVGADRNLRWGVYQNGSMIQPFATITTYSDGDGGYPTPNGAELATHPKLVFDGADVYLIWVYILTTGTGFGQGNGYIKRNIISTDVESGATVLFGPYFTSTYWLSPAIQGAVSDGNGNTYVLFSPEAYAATQTRYIIDNDTVNEWKQTDFKNQEYRIDMLDDGRVLIYTPNYLEDDPTSAHYALYQDGVFTEDFELPTRGNTVCRPQVTSQIKQSAESDFFILFDTLFYKYVSAIPIPPEDPVIPIDCGQVGQILALDVATQTLAPSTVPDATMDCACCAPVLSSYDCGSAILEVP